MIDWRSDVDRDYPKLTEQHHVFLRHIAIAPDQVMDASGLTRSEWQDELRARNRTLALVDKPCKRGHRLRLRVLSGHCVECSPQSISYVKRHHEEAYVYILVSARLKLLKIGSALKTTNRAEGLNRDGYAGTDDWRFCYRRKFRAAGEVEAKVHSILQSYRQKRPYKRLGHGTITEANELFSCDYELAKAAIEEFYEQALDAGLELNRPKLGTSQNT